MPDPIEVSGLAELRETLLKRLPESLQGKASQAALTRAARPIVDAAKAKAPTRMVGPVQPGKQARGRLRDSIKSWRNRESTRTYESRYIGVTARAYYWRWIEFGRGTIEATKSLGTVIKGFFGKTIKAVPARPFLRPAFEENAARAIEIVRQSLGPAIERVAERARRRNIRSLAKKITGF